jgi:hypothetical protein
MSTSFVVRNTSTNKATFTNWSRVQTTKYVICKVGQYICLCVVVIIVLEDMLSFIRQYAWIIGDTVFRVPVMSNTLFVLYLLIHTLYILKLFTFSRECFQDVKLFLLVCTFNNELRYYLSHESALKNVLSLKYVL